VASVLDCSGGRGDRGGAGVPAGVECLRATEPTGAWQWCSSRPIGACLATTSISGRLRSGVHQVCTYFPIRRRSGSTGMNGQTSSPTGRPGVHRALQRVRRDEDPAALQRSVTARSWVINVFCSVGPRGCRCRSPTLITTPAIGGDLHAPDRDLSHHRLRRPRHARGFFEA